MKLRLSTFAMLLLSATAAFANTEAGAGAGGGAGMPGGQAPIMFRAGGMGTIAMAGYDLPSIGIAYLPIDHMMVAAALSLNFNGNGSVQIAPGIDNDLRGGPTDKWASGILLAVEYMLVDAMPFAMGPAFAFRGSFAPGSFFSTVQLMPSWDLWYTPFNAPVAIGTSLGMMITLTNGFEPVFQFYTPGLRLAYTF